MLKQFEFVNLSGPLYTIYTYIYIYVVGKFKTVSIVLTIVLVCVCVTAKLCLRVGEKRRKKEEQITS